MARQYHPDVAKDKQRAEERFKEINEAYEVLGDAEKRARYDELGANWKAGAEFRPPPGWQGFAGARPFGGGGPQPGAEFRFGGTGFSDFFEQLFGSMRGGRGGFQFHPGEEEELMAERGRDIEGDIMVTLEEAMRGSVRSVTVRNGQRAETYQVRIPVGVREGQRLRLSGRGELGSGGGSAGDLYLRVRLARHPDFEIRGHDLVHETGLAPWEAVLGTTVKVPTLQGEVSIRIPAGTQNGQKLRVRGKGLPARDGSHGDLIVQARLEVPKHIGDSERPAWEALARTSAFKARAD